MFQQSQQLLYFFVFWLQTLYSFDIVKYHFLDIFFCCNVHGIVLFSISLTFFILYSSCALAPFFLCLLKCDGGCGLFLYSFRTRPHPPAAHTLENSYRAATLNNPQNKTKSLGSLLQNLSFVTLRLADISMSILFISKHVPNRTEYVV